MPDMWVYLVGLFVFIVAGIVYVSSLSVRPTLESYMVADRRVGFWRGSAATSAGWVHAPAILISPKFLAASWYQFGAYAVFGFIAPFVIAFTAVRVQHVLNKKGYNMPMLFGRLRPMSRVLVLVPVVGSFVYVAGQSMTVIQQVIQQVFQQVVVGGVVVPGWVFAAVAAILAAYVVLRGLPTAITGDAAKVGAIVALVIIGLVVEYHYWSLDAVRAVIPPAAKDPLWQLWAVGLALAVSSSTGMMCNPDIGEVVNAIKTERVQQAFATSGFFYLFAVGAVCSFGPLAQRLGMSVSGQEFPMLTVMMRAATDGWLAAWVLPVVVGLILVTMMAAVASTVDAAGDVFAFEMVRRMKPSITESQTIAWSQGFMAFMLLLCVGIAYASPDLTILAVVVAGARGMVFVPYFVSLYVEDQLLRRYVSWGMVVALLGVVFSSGNFVMTTFFGHGVPFLRDNGFALGALVSLGAPAVALGLALCVRALRQRRVVLA